MANQKKPKAGKKTVGKKDARLKNLSQSKKGLTEDQLKAIKGGCKIESRY
jgi:hypothetical protein